jgi:hypothetical protein
VAHFNQTGSDFLAGFAAARANGGEFVVDDENAHGPDFSANMACGKAANG